MSHKTPPRYLLLIFRDQWDTYLSHGLYLSSRKSTYLEEKFNWRTDSTICFFAYVMRANSYNVFFYVCFYQDSLYSVFWCSAIAKFLEGLVFALWKCCLLFGQSWIQAHGEPFEDSSHASQAFLCRFLRVWGHSSMYWHYFI